MTIPGMNSLLGHRSPRRMAGGGPRLDPLRSPGAGSVRSASLALIAAAAFACGQGGEDGAGSGGGPSGGAGGGAAAGEGGAGGAAGCSQARPSETHAWSFDEDRAGSPPAGFTVVLGDWEVDEDPEAPSGKKVLRGSGGGSTEEMRVVYADGPCFDDFTLRVKCRQEEGVLDQACGLVFRLQDGGNYLLVRANALEDNVRIYPVIDGERKSPFGTAGADMSDAEWHVLEVTARGDRFTVSWDDEELISAEDDTYDAGRVGLWLKTDAITSFDDLQATAE